MGTSSETPEKNAIRKQDGGPAFPRTGAWPDFKGVHNEDLHAAMSTVTAPEKGMTLRDYFAASAMTGLLHVGADPDAAPWVLAEHAYLFADAMLEARKT